MLNLASSPVAPILGQHVPLRGPSRVLFRSYAKTRCSPGHAVRRLTTKFGDDFEVDLSSFLEWQLWAFGAFEEQLSEMFAYLVRPGDRCIDVGTNVGVHATRLAKLAGPAGEVIAIEPDQGVADRAARNFALNGLGNVRLIRAAASAHGNEQVTLYRPGDDETNKAQASVLPLPYLTGQQASVATVRIDDICAGPVAFMKIDVEGHEVAVVQGAARVIADYSPAIAFEYAPELLADPAETPFGWLQDQGYELYQVRNARHRITGRGNPELTHLMEMPALGGDFLALSSAMIPRVRSLIT